MSTYGQAIEVIEDVLQAEYGGYQVPVALHIAEALDDAGLLARPLPTREEIAEELSGWPIGTGYYQTTIATDEAREIADAVLALLKGQEA